MANLITDRFSISKREETEEGFLKVEDSKLARTGILIYSIGEIDVQDAPEGFDGGGSGVVRVFRSAKEVFNKETLESFKSRPITLEHPDKFVDSKNFKNESVGMSKDDVRREGNFMLATLMILDENAVKNIKSGVEELSLGYTADVQYKPGVTDDGEVYDAVMTNIRGNHIAIVPRGRNGRNVKLSDEDINKKEVNNMPEENKQTIIVDGVSFSCSQQTAEVVNKLVDDNHELEKEIDRLKEIQKEEMEDLEVKQKEAMDKLHEELDSAHEKVTDADKLDELVAERSVLVDNAEKLIKDFKHDGLSNPEIKSQVVAKVCDIDLKEKSEEYIDARFDGLIQDKAKGTEGYKEVFNDHAKDVKDSDENLSASQKKRKALMDKNHKILMGVTE